MQIQVAIGHVDLAMNRLAQGLDEIVSLGLAPAPEGDHGQPGGTGHRLLLYDHRRQASQLCEPGGGIRCGEVKGKVGIRGSERCGIPAGKGHRTRCAMEGEIRHEHGRAPAGTGEAGRRGSEHEPGGPKPGGPLGPLTVRMVGHRAAQKGDGPHRAGTLHPVRHQA